MVVIHKQKAILTPAIPPKGLGSRISIILLLKIVLDNCDKAIMSKFKQTYPVKLVLLHVDEHNHDRKCG